MRVWPVVRYVMVVAIVTLTALTTVSVLASTQIIGVFIVGLVVGCFLGIGVEASAALLIDRTGGR